MDAQWLNPAILFESFTFSTKYITVMRYHTPEYKTPCHNCPESLITHSRGHILYPLLPSLNKCNNLSPLQRHLQGEKLVAFWDVTVGEILYSGRCTVPLSTLTLHNIFASGSRIRICDWKKKQLGNGPCQSYRFWVILMVIILNIT